MRMPLALMFAAPLALAGAAACSSSSSPQEETSLTPQEASRTLDETFTRAGEFVDAASNEATFTQAFDRLAQELNIDFQGPCPDGGSATLNGSLSLPDDASEAINADFNLAVAYQACSGNGIILDGDFSYATTVDVDESTGMSVTLDASGALDVSGELEESCTFDLQIALSMDLASENFDFDLDASGHFCGYDINELDLDGVHVGPGGA